MIRITTLAVIVLIASASVKGDQLLVGAASVSITPNKPISLAGQFHQRISKKVGTPCTANIIAIEAKADGKTTGQAVLISMDVVYSTAEVQKKLQETVAARLSDLDVKTIFTSATHTHTGPTLNQDRFNDYGDAMQPKDYVPWMINQMADGVVKAWQVRKPAQVAWGLGHAVVAQNRRSSYANGSAAMYGKVDREDFIGLEGWEDHAVDILCFTDAEKKLIATAITVPCPSQVVESRHEINADYWHHVRENIKTKYGSDLVVAGFCGPAGDMVPRPMLRRAAEARMERMRKLSREAELGRRIALAFDDVWQVIQQDLRSDVTFAHTIEQIELPGYKLNKAEYESAKKSYSEYADQDDTNSRVYSRKRFFKRTIDRYESQEKQEPFHTVELRVIRVGDLVIATNPFELFQDFAMRIHGRTTAQQTMLIQLASPIEISGSYLPSARAQKGGGYSAIPQSNRVGPEGGQILVEHTLEGIKKVLE